MPSSVPAGRNLYWDIVANRAETFFNAARRPGSPWAVLQVLLNHASEFGLPTTTHIAQMVLAAVVHEDCPDSSRTVKGTASLNLLVPSSTNPLTILQAADVQHLVLGTPFADGITSAEQQAEATIRARVAVQDALDAVPDGRAGRERMIHRFYQLHDDPRALIAVALLTAAAVRAVASDS